MDKAQAAFFFLISLSSFLPLFLSFIFIFFFFKEETEATMRAQS